MLGIPFLETAFRMIKPTLHDDTIDRLNYYITSPVLLFFAILVSAKQYVGKPIQCWVPAQFRGGWEQYTEDFCFIKNTYFVPFEEDIPSDHDVRGDSEIGYYQWVPIVLALQALLFQLPHMLWTCLNWQSGLNLDAVLKMASESSIQEPEKREGSIQKLARFIEESLGVQRDLSSYGMAQFVPCGRHFGSYVSNLYIVVKLLYLVNVVGQFFLLNSFLGTDYTFWGVEIMADLVGGREWRDSGHFPRVTLCDFHVRVLGNLHRHTVQCVLMINLFTEKIYLFLWFWLLLVACATAINFIYWVFTSMLSGPRETVIKKYLRVSCAVTNSPSDCVAIRRFTTNALRPDGVLIIRFISAHVSDMVSMELTGVLWKDYLSQVATLPQMTKGSPFKVSNPSMDRGAENGGLVETIYPVDGSCEKQKIPCTPPPGAVTTPLLASAPGENGTIRSGYPYPPPGPKPFQHH